MLYKTRGIVFRYVKYGDTSIIVTIFTDQFGLQAYLVNGVRSRSGRGMISLYQPLTLLDLVVYHRENANLLRIKEAKCLHAYQHIHQDIRKTTIALFLHEILNKAVKDQSNTESIFDFLMRSFISLDQLEGIENFHLQFLIQLSRHLGFGAHETREVLEGSTSPDEEAALRQLLDTGFESPPDIPYSMRKHLLDQLLSFYYRHIEGMPQIRSIDVLKEILR
ncbi:MAG: DNA repair protein RecO [Cyclobacteriaceae bacterium]|nr:DNA repair protein RecO [Cyclobacteriaceae bacterium]